MHYIVKYILKFVQKSHLIIWLHLTLDYPSFDFPIPYEKKEEDEDADTWQRNQLRRCEDSEVVADEAAVVAEEAEHSIALSLCAEDGLQAIAVDVVDFAAPPDEDVAE